MGGRESEALFDSLNLDPQLFINGTLNVVDDLLEEAFTFYFQEAVKALKIEQTNRAQDLRKGVNHIRNLVQSALDKWLLVWEKHCLGHCFSVPPGLSLPTNTLLSMGLLKSCDIYFLGKVDTMKGKKDAFFGDKDEDESLCDDLICKDALNDSELDQTLDSLRTKLFLVGKESSSLSRELQELKNLIVSENSSITILNETLQLYEQNVSDEMFQELMKTAEELRAKILKIKTGTRKIEHIKVDNAYNSDQDLYPTIYGESLCNAMLEDMEEFVDNMKSI